jgi:hypothetical protein
VRHFSHSGDYYLLTLLGRGRFDLVDDIFHRRFRRFYLILAINSEHVSVALEELLPLSFDEGACLVKFVRGHRTALVVMVRVLTDHGCRLFVLACFQ